MSFEGRKRLSPYKLTPRSMFLSTSLRLNARNPLMSKPGDIPTQVGFSYIGLCALWVAHTLCIMSCATLRRAAREASYHFSTCRTSADDLNLLRLSVLAIYWLNKKYVLQSHPSYRFTNRTPLRFASQFTHYSPQTVDMSTMTQLHR